MGYVKTVEFTGDSRKAIEVAQAALVHAGYKLLDLSDTRVSARHEGGFVKSQSGNTICGASPVTVSIGNNRLTVRADYEGIDKIKAFLLRLFIGLALILGFALGITFALVFEDKWQMWFGIGMGAGIPLLQLPIHLLITPRVMRKRAETALNTLTDNIIMVAR